MHWLLMWSPSTAATSTGNVLKPSSHMSSPDLINISPRQSPVINRLHDAMTAARSYAQAIEDNAIDHRDPLHQDLVASFAADYYAIITHLQRAADV